MSRVLRAAAACVATALVAGGLSTLLALTGVPAPAAVGVSIALGMVVGFGLIADRRPAALRPACDWCRYDIHIHDANTGVCISRQCSCEVTR